MVIEDIVIRALRKAYRMQDERRRQLRHVTVSDADASDYIYSKLMDSEPFMACRFGSTEFSALQYAFLGEEPYLARARAYIKGFVDAYRADTASGKNAVHTLCFFSGFFPDDVSLLERFYSQAVEDMKEVDLLGVWLKEDLFSSKLADAEFCNLGCLEPYDYEYPWSKALEGKKVLVVHPFAETIESQYSKRDKLWDNPAVLPDFELHTIKAVQSIAGEKVPYDTWFDALDDMKRQMDATDYDIAIIGCGAYGFHLAAHAKRSGKKAVHLGGATQILFGIKGKRWDDLPVVSKFYNENWVYPSADETPRDNKKVENGCYW